jgi:FkbM family methyltransferase
MAEHRQDIAARQAQLRQAGFRPSRHSAAVRLVRRLLWPFMRPFAFHLLDLNQSLEARLATGAEARLAGLEAQIGSIAALSARLDGQAGEAAGHAARFLEQERQLAALTAELETLRDGARMLEQQKEQQHHRLTEQQQQLKQEQEQQLAALRAELQAVAGHGVRTDEMQGVTLRQAAQRAELAALTNRQVWLESTIEELAGDRASAIAAIQDLAASRAGLEARHAEWEKKHRLFLSRTHDGIFVLKAGELISDMAAQDGEWDVHILRAASAAAEVARQRVPGGRAGRAVDAGAHFGLLTVALARRFDAVTSFEPNEFNASLLRTNVALNDLGEKVEIRRAALFSRRTQLSLAPSEEQEIPLPLDAGGGFDPLSASNLGAYSFTEAGSGMSSAPAYPLDDLALDDLAFLKIDVQGADGEVLMGARDTIRRCRSWIVFEWEDTLSRAFGVTLEQMQAQLRDLDYTFRVLKRHNEKQVDYLAVPAAEAEQLDRLLGLGEAPQRGPAGGGA